MQTYHLQTPTNLTTKAIIFLPGMSGGALSARFDPFARACRAAGFAIARVSIWNDGEDLKTKTFGEIHIELSKIIESLVSEGYTSLYLVGKSFGGGVALSHFSPYIKVKVAWAPAIGVSDEGMLKQLSTPLGEFSSFLDIKMSEKVLKSIYVPVLIIHGTADASIPLSNSEELVSKIGNGNGHHGAMVTIAGADHSFKEKAHEEMLIKETIAFCCHTPNAAPLAAA